MADTQDKLLKYKIYLEKNTDGDKVLHIFKKIMKLPVTVQILQNTGIGKVVNSFRKTEGDIGIIAKTIVTGWKVLVSEEAQRLSEIEQNPDNQSPTSESDSSSHCENPEESPLRGQTSDEERLVHTEETVCKERSSHKHHKEQNNHRKSQAHHKHRDKKPENLNESSREIESGIRYSESKNNRTGDDSNIGGDDEKRGGKCGTISDSKSSSRHRDDSQRGNKKDSVSKSSSSKQQGDREHGNKESSDNRSRTNKHQRSHTSKNTGEVPIIGGDDEKHGGKCGTISDSKSSSRHRDDSQRGNKKDSVSKSSSSKQQGDREHSNKESSDNRSHTNKHQGSHTSKNISHEKTSSDDPQSKSDSKPSSSKHRDGQSGSEKNSDRKTSTSSKHQNNSSNKSTPDNHQNDTDYKSGSSKHRSDGSVSSSHKRHEDDKKNRPDKESHKVKVQETSEMESVRKHSSSKKIEGEHSSKTSSSKHKESHKKHERNECDKTVDKQRVSEKSTGKPSSNVNSSEANVTKIGEADNIQHRKHKHSSEKQRHKTMSTEKTVENKGSKNNDMSKSNSKSILDNCFSHDELGDEKISKKSSTISKSRSDKSHRSSPVSSKSHSDKNGKSDSNNTSHSKSSPTKHDEGSGSKSSKPKKDAGSSKHKDYKHHSKSHKKSHHSEDKHKKHDKLEVSLFGDILSGLDKSVVKMSKSAPAKSDQIKRKAEVDYEQLKSKFKVKKKANNDNESTRKRSAVSDSEETLSKPTGAKQMKLPEDEFSYILPETSAHYRPWRFSEISDKTQKEAEIDPAEMAYHMKSHGRSQMYSGRKTTGVTEMFPLFEICMKVLMNNIDSLDNVGAVPFFILKPVLEKCSVEQLYRLEDLNPQFLEDSDCLWKVHCEKDFRSCEPDEMESYRELYIRLYDERETRLKALKNNIADSMAKATPVRTTKLAYVDSTVKPPRDVRRQQLKHGTAFVSVPANSSRARFASSMDVIAPSRFKQGGRPVPPMMQKTMKLMKSMNRR
ncbi:hypothetical protein ScPMuIL_007504 [Solemya velum]